MKKIDDALKLAFDLHQHQKRKIGDVPYLFHVIDTAVILHNYGFREEIIIAGLLHDAVEAGKIGLDEIRSKFGKKVASTIEKCTEVSDPNWHYKKELYLKQIDNDNARAVACADKISNLKETYRWQQEVGDEIWKIFKTGKEGQQWFHDELTKVLKFDHLIYQEFLKWQKKVFQSWN